MDDLRKLFKKIKGRNHNSFEVLSDNYGWKLYSYIRRRSSDRTEADLVFSETFQKFYSMVENFEGDDPIEAMLIACADQAKAEHQGLHTESREIGRWELGQETGFSLPEVRREKKQNRIREFFGKLLYVLCVMILILGILIALWVMAWMLMAMEVIPKIDLGYGWFNTYVANLF